MSDKQDQQETASNLNRREFLSRGAAVSAAGAAAVAAPNVFADVNAGKNNDINVALLGAGTQGRVQMNAILKIPGVRIKAVCDIWEYSQRYTSRYAKKFGHVNTVYENHQEMLEKEKDIDAVCIASPDFMHAPHTVDCLNAGKAVYCEKMMSNSIEAAADMVRAQRKSGKLLQIGHQRRSNPRYLHLKNKLIGEAKLFGGLTHANAQWNRGKSGSAPLGWPKKYTMPDEKLQKYGYGSMKEFRNWRYYKKYGGGAISDLGAHQIDILNWMFDGMPASVIASGGSDFYPEFEHYDNVMAIYEYATKRGPSRAFYQVLTTTSSLGFLERFMGLEGTVAISENPKWNSCYREAQAPEWTDWVEKGYLKKDAPKTDEAKPDVVVDARESAALDEYDIPVELNKLIHQPHLENFFDVVRKGGKQTDLNCPAEVGYSTCVTVLKINEAVQQGKKLEFKPEEFIVS